MKKRVLVLGLIALVVVAGAVFALTRSSPSGPKPLAQALTCPTENEPAVETDLSAMAYDKTEALVGAARLWGIVRYFYPALAQSDDVDWEGALVNALPALEDASSPAEYRERLSELTGALGDPATRIVESNGSTSANAVFARFVSQSAPNGLVILRACYSSAPADEDDSNLLAETRENASAVVFDLREGPGPDSGPDDRYESALRLLLEKTIPYFIDKPLMPMLERYLKYEGYPAQGFGSTTYRRTFRSTSPESIQPDNDAKPVRMVFLTGSKTPAVFDIIVGGQTSVGARVTFEGSAEDAETASARVFAVQLPYGLTGLVRVAEFSSASFQPDVLSPDGGAEAAQGDAALQASIRLTRKTEHTHASEPPSTSVAPLPLKEEPYPEMSPPSREYRLLALFRFGNVINHFSPYLDLIDPPWDAALGDFIPRFRAASTERGYLAAVAELTARVGDSHVAVGGPATSREYGTALPGIVVRLVESQWVIVLVRDDEAKDAGLHRGTSS